MTKKNQDNQRDLNIENLHLFLNMVRKSGNDLTFVTTSSGVEYKMAADFNHENWLKALKTGKEMGELSKCEIEVFKNLIDEISHIKEIKCQQ